MGSSLRGGGIGALVCKEEAEAERLSVRGGEAPPRLPGQRQLSWSVQSAAHREAVEARRDMRRLARASGQERPGLKPCPQIPGPRIPGPGLLGACGPACPWLTPFFPRLSQCVGAAAALGAPVSGVELDSLISQVKDLLPDLGEGFILACLEHCGYDPEQVINDILEERLAPALRQLDRGLGRWGHREGAPSSLLCVPLFLPRVPGLGLLSPRAVFPDH